MNEQLFYILLSVAILLCLLYSSLILKYCKGWVSIEPIALNNFDTKVTIVIAARNEEKNITNCLLAIAKQTYLEENMEIIVVDDASEDATNIIIQEFRLKLNNLKLITLNEVEGGKKKAIQAALAVATGELIVTTDADCIMEPDWLKSIVSFYNKTGAKMIVGPVCFYDEKNIFEKMQSLEFMGLMASGGGSLFYNKAIMCNGANLAYTKQVFEEVNGFEGVDNKASGDDVLLMYKIEKRYPQSIKFIKNQESIIFTKAQCTLNDFVNQRKRWASKGFGALNSETKKVSLAVYLFNFCLLFIPLLCMTRLSGSSYSGWLLEICLILFVFKCVIDFLLLFLSASFFKRKKFLIYLLPEQVLYVFYVTITGFLGMFGKYRWKGRITK